MQSSSWVALLKQLPEETYSSLMLVTTNGTEITIQNLLRIDHEFMVVRGRVAGTQVDGRVFFIPYAQVVYVGFQQPIKEAEFKAISEGIDVPEPLPPSDSLAALSVVTPPAPGNGLPGVEDTQPRIAIKSEVLERYRSRTPGSGSTMSPPPQR
jgi:hypothetical protein